MNQAPLKMHSKKVSLFKVKSNLAIELSEILEHMPEREREQFEILYSTKEYDIIARHRAIVRGIRMENTCDEQGFPVEATPLKGIFFVTETGDRMIIGQDIKAWPNKKRGSRETLDSRDRKHLLRNQNLDFANRSIQYSYIGRHDSEKGWNLPREHDRHFLNLPWEVRLQILEHVLVAKAPIQPITILCSWKKELELPGFDLAGLLTGDKFQRRKIRIQRRDQYGAFVEERTILTQPIDATCLRVNKQFNLEGSMVLYGNNDFDCSRLPSCVAVHESVVNMSDRGYEFIHRAQKPHLKMVGTANFEVTVRHLWGDRKTDDYIPGWIYCDPFLRFLRTIGPSNAAILRSVSLLGTITKVHVPAPLACTRECTRECLKYQLRLYGHFVQTHCPNIRQVNLRPAAWSVDGMHGKILERILIQMLESEIWRFTGLKDLVVTPMYDYPMEALETFRKEIRVSGVAQFRPERRKSQGKTQDGTVL